jgi:hypothetical protein
VAGLRDKPGVPQTGWQRWEGPIDLGAAYEYCERCRRPIRYVSVMRHSGWPDLVRVGRGCAIIMMGKWGVLVANGSTFIGQNLWPAIFWLVVLVLIGFWVLA